MALCAVNDKSRKDFSLRLFINPGGDLLSRDLSSDYHRRSNVSLPGSEWDRVGPLGYDHQASALLCTSSCVLRTSACLAIVCHGVSCVCYLRLCLRVKQADIRVAMCVGFPSFAFPLNQAFLFKACHRGWYEVYWMLVALGSIHYCNYTCALSTWSSSTLL